MSARQSGWQGPRRVPGLLPLRNPVQPVPGSAPLPRLKSVNGRACSRSDGGARARDCESATLPAAPARPLPSPAGRHPGRGGRGVRRRQRDVRSPALALSLAASQGDPPQLPAPDAPGGALWRREALRAAPQMPPIGCAASVRPGMEAPRRGLGAAEATAIGGTRGGHTEGVDRPPARVPSVIAFSHAAWAPELGLEGNLDSSEHQGVTFSGICSLQ